MRRHCGTANGTGLFGLELAAKLLVEGLTFIIYLKEGRLPSQCVGGSYPSDTDQMKAFLEIPG